MANQNEVRFTARIDKEIAAKLAFISDYYGRSQNGQINWLIKQNIAQFEKKHGKIEVTDKP